MMFLALFTAGLVGILHLYFLVLEMFLWTKPLGLKVFNLTEDFAKESRTLAMNQGLYNGFLGIGILYGVTTGNFEFIVFFLSCVIIAGIFGGFTVSKKIFVVQGLPALVSLLINFLAFS